MPKRWIESKYILIHSQGIEIAISELTGPTDCSTDYLEVGPSGLIQDLTNRHFCSTCVCVNDTGAISFYQLTLRVWHSLQCLGEAWRRLRRPIGGKHLCLLKVIILMLMIMITITITTNIIILNVESEGWQILLNCWNREDQQPQGVEHFGEWKQDNHPKIWRKRL